MEAAILEGSEKGLSIIFGKEGRGIVASRHFTSGEYVIEYRGELICDPQKTKKREDKYEKTDEGCYMYYFYYKDKRYW